MVKELPVSHSKCSDILPTLISHFWRRHPIYNSESHANGTKLSYFSTINMTAVRCRGTWRCSDAIKFVMESLSAIARNWFTESGASWCRRLNAISSNTYEVNCIYGRGTCRTKRKYPSFNRKYSLFIKSVMDLYGKEEISIHTEVATSCCSTNIWADIILTIYYSLITQNYRGVIRYCPMCWLQMSQWVLKCQAICNHIADSLAVTQDNENYYYRLCHHLTGTNAGSLIELSDLPCIRDQGTGLFMPTIKASFNHHMYYISEIIYWISQFITHTRVYNSLNKHIRLAKDTHCYVESPASHHSVTRFFWSSHPPPAKKMRVLR